MQKALQDVQRLGYRGYADCAANCRRRGINRRAPRRYDNAVAETSFARLRRELVNRRAWPSRRDLQAAVLEYIEGFHNRQSRQCILGDARPHALSNDNQGPNPVSRKP